MKTNRLMGMAMCFISVWAGAVCADPGVVSAFYEEFDSDPFPPTGWVVQGSATRTTNYALSTPYSVLLNSDKAALVTPNMIATGHIFTCRYLNAQPGDMLRIEYSNDDGTTWSFHRKYSASPNYWALITVDLDAFAERTAKTYIQRYVKLRLIWDAFNETNSIVCIDNCRLAETSRALTAPVDFDGDGKSDVAAYYPDAGLWYIRQSFREQLIMRNWGWSASIPVAADYDGDGITDNAVFAEGWWYINSSVQGPMAPINYGFSGCMPVPSDFNGDGAADLVLYYPDTGTWFVKFLSAGLNAETDIAVSQGTAVRNWGFLGAYPVPADYDSDGLADLCVFSPEYGCWYLLTSSSGYTQPQFVHWGWYQMYPLAADFIGAGSAGLSGYYADAGAWLSRDQGLIGNWGWSQAWPMLGDYDGDGITDAAVAAHVAGKLIFLLNGSLSGPQEPVEFSAEGLIPVSGAEYYIY